MIRLVLENNNFSFNGKHYLQVEGTAIGSRLGMNYASTYLGVWEQQLLEQSSDKPHTYFRYVDDIWGIWLHGEKKLKKFHDLANSIHPRIKIELKFSKNQIEFLDTIIVLDNGFLYFKVSFRSSSSTFNSCFSIRLELYPRCVNLSFILLLSFSYSSLSSQIRLTLTPKPFQWKTLSTGGRNSNRLTFGYELC
jgi:hypothetical protein